MSGPTKIEWAEAVWNPVTGCTKVSGGCRNCYAERMAKRLAGRAGYPAEHPFAVTLHPDRLDEPLHWRKPRRIFVCSMSDLFHDRVPDTFIEKVFAICAESTWHDFLILTKHAGRMAAFLRSEHIFSRIDGQACSFVEEGIRMPAEPRGWHGAWPLPNVWLGTSIEDQASADERIPHLLRCPAAARFVSYEPALGPVNLARLHDDEVGAHWDSLQMGLHWVIAGGESGPNARPAHPDWFRSVRDQCRAAGVPFFFKQWGGWAEEGFEFADKPNAARQLMRAVPHARVGELGTPGCPESAWMVRVGKKAAGRLLDGVEHNAYPGKVNP